MNLGTALQDDEFGTDACIVLQYDTYPSIPLRMSTHHVTDYRFTIQVCAELIHDTPAVRLPVERHLFTSTHTKMYNRMLRSIGVALRSNTLVLQYDTRNEKSPLLYFQ